MTYIEVMIASVLIVTALLPAIDALYTGMRGAGVYESSSSQHYAAVALMEEVLAEPFSMLVAAAAAASKSAPSSYSDAGGTPDRRLVYVALYDADNEDGDGNVFTVLDPNADKDSDPYTGYSGVLWVRVEVEGTVTSLQSLAAP